MHPQACATGKTCFLHCDLQHFPARAAVLLHLTCTLPPPPLFPLCLSPTEWLMQLPLSWARLTSKARKLPICMDTHSIHARREPGAHAPRCVHLQACAAMVIFVEDNGGVLDDESYNTYMASLVQHSHALHKYTYDQVDAMVRCSTCCVCVCTAVHISRVRMRRHTCKCAYFG